jgi:hypothetical protein
MLFDLRGRGRRRTVQGIYLFLAVIMGGGLVFLGIGTGNNFGSVFDALGGSNGSGATDVFERQAKQADKRLKANPNDAAAWAALARARVQQAAQGDNVDQKTGQLTGKGRAKVQAASMAWQRYLALNPPAPDDALAGLMVQAYGPSGLNDPAKGLKAAEIVTQKRPSAQGFYQLAVFAYAAKDERRGDLAAAKTLQLTPAARKTQTKLLLQQAKKPQGSAGGVPGPAPSPGTSATGQ